MQIQQILHHQMFLRMCDNHLRHLRLRPQYYQL
jgi:hypothetical protein